MKMKELFKVKATPKMKRVKIKEAESMSAEEIEGILDDIQSEFGDEFNKDIGNISGLLVHKDLSAATRATENLMDKVRAATED